MKKFVILSFVFLALGFYELSGGASFDPETTRMAMIDARQEREATRLAELPDLPPVAEIAPPAETVVADAPASSENETTRAPLNLVSFESASQPPPDAPQASAPLGPTDFVDEPEPEVTLESLQANVAQTQSIAFQGTTLRSGDLTQPSDQDIRAVKGTLVNVRSGPGTDYEIVDQLEQATEVVVLSDTGNGWVEFRTLDRGTTGWIAAFLLTGG